MNYVNNKIYTLDSSCRNVEDMEETLDVWCLGLLYPLVFVVRVFLFFSFRFFFYLFLFIFAKLDVWITKISRACVVL